MQRRMPWPGTRGGLLDGEFLPFAELPDPHVAADDAGDEATGAVSAEVSSVVSSRELVPGTSVDATLAIEVLVDPAVAAAELGADAVSGAAGRVGPAVTVPVLPAADAVRNAIHVGIGAAGEPVPGSASGAAGPVAGDCGPAPPGLSGEGGGPVAGGGGPARPGGGPVAGGGGPARPGGGPVAGGAEGSSSSSNCSRYCGEGQRTLPPYRLTCCSLSNWHSAWLGRFGRHRALRRLLVSSSQRSGSVAADGSIGALRSSD